MNPSDFPSIAPQIVLGAGIILAMLADVLFTSRSARAAQLVTLVTLVAAALMTVLTWGGGGNAFYDMVRGDGFSSFFNLVFILAAFLVALSSSDYLERLKLHKGEYYMLVLLATLGMTFMAAGHNLLVIFLGIETMSISLYVLAGFNTARPRSNEAALKYLLLGAFSTGFLLYGIAMIYGQTGSTSLTQFAAYLAGAANPMAGYMGIGLALLLIGLAFKMAAVPFHFWSPDAYEGAPTPVTAFMSAAPKAAAFAAALRVFYPSAASLGIHWQHVVWVLAALTMTLGNLSALRQTSIKRMLAYSSIAHAGYLLVGFLAGNALGASGMLFYLGGYAFMNIGAFTVAYLVNRRGQGQYAISDYAQLGYRRPVLAAIMTIFMLSLIGIPPLAGFFGKLYVFSGAVQAGYIWLVVIGVLNSALSVFYYLSVVVNMYMREAEGLEDVKPSPAVMLTVALCALIIILLGVFPNPLLDLARASVGSMM
jgi:NADH-quinone oxidoreductase subunit N